LVKSESRVSSSVSEVQSTPKASVKKLPPQVLEDELEERVETKAIFYQSSTSPSAPRSSTVVEDQQQLEEESQVEAIIPVNFCNCNNILQCIFIPYRSVRLDWTMAPRLDRVFLREVKLQFRNLFSNNNSRKFIGLFGDN
jgi:hypothetical protein